MRAYINRHDRKLSSFPGVEKPSSDVQIRAWAHSPGSETYARPATLPFPEQGEIMTTATASTDKAAGKVSAPLSTPSDLKSQGTAKIAEAMNGILADVFALYLKTKNFHWHMSGPHFRDYHLLLDEQAVQIYAMVDMIAERIRKVGQPTLRSIGDIARRQRIKDNDAEYVTPGDMLGELQEDNKLLAARLREAHEVCDQHHDIATASLIEVWIDETEQRTWFLFEANRGSDSTGH
jgi:starvation-inducible DNA-binding protein